METLSEAIERLARQIKRIEEKPNPKKLRLMQLKEWLKELQLRRVEEKVRRRKAQEGKSKAEKPEALQEEK